MTKQEERLLHLISRATTGGYATTYEFLAHDALDAIGDAINVTTFALNPDSQKVVNVNDDTLLLELGRLSTRAKGIAALLREVKLGRLTLADDEEERAAGKVSPIR